MISSIFTHRFPMNFSLTRCKTAILAIGCAAILQSCADTSPIDTAEPVSGIEYDRSLISPELLVPNTDAPLRKVAALCSTSVITNGGFELNGGAGSSAFTGWTVYNEVNGSGNWYVQSGTGSPLNGFTVQPPPEGSFAAMTDQGGGGTHILSQEFVVPNGGANISFELFILNQAGAFYNNASLSHTQSPNQQFRADIMTPTSAIDDMGAGILQNLYVTLPGDATTSGYVTVSGSISAALGGQTVRLRFAEVDNQLYFHTGVDNVCIVPSAIPVDLDIKPQGTNNRFKLSSDGKKMVAIMSDASFDATTVSPTSIRLGDESGSDTPIMLKKSGQPHYWLQDIDLDGDVDFLMYFNIPSLVGNGDVTCGQTEIVINGTTNAGAAIRGVDDITVDCGTPQ